MSIATKHPSYIEAESMWDLVSDFTDGEQEVKAANDIYLPRLSGQTEPQYQAIKNRTIFFPVTSKTCAGLLGAVFYKPPEVTLPLRISYLEQKATSDGSSMSDLATQVVKSLLEYGRVGLLVDRPADGGAPYLVVYDGDDITNWDTQDTEKFIVLEEEIFVRDPKDKYSLEQQEQYRELMLDANGEYIVNIHREVKDKKTRKNVWEIVDTIKPTKGGRPLTYIPFACASPDGLSFNIVKSPLYDLASVNWKHYMYSSSYSDAVHTLCFPTPWIAANLNNDNGTLTFNLGAKTAWVLPEGSQVGFVEVDGKSLQHAENMLDRLEQTALSIGARFVSQSKISTGVETAKGSEIRENQATEMLSSILVVTESLLNWGAKICAEWEGADPEEVSIKLNKDLVRSNLDANMVNALFGGYLKGTISAETLYKNMNESNMYGIDNTFEKEFASIKKRMDEQAAAITKAAQDAMPPTDTGVVTPNLATQNVNNA